MIELRFESRLAVSPDVLWQQARSMAGVNAELGPWLRMSFPPEQAVLVVKAPGQRLFSSWLQVFALIPIDRHHLALDAVYDDPGAGTFGFDERSSSWTQRVWIHRRRIVQLEGGCCVIDTLQFEPRVEAAARLLRSVITWVFRHRHGRLRARFGKAFA